MTLTIKPMERSPLVAATTQASPERRQMTEELLAAMTAWDPKERLGAFRVWLRGSLSLVHLQVLTTLESEGPLPMSRLAEALDVSIASATGIVDRMEERRLVERHHGYTDRRLVFVRMTRRGARVFDTMARSRRAQLVKVLARLEDDEIAAFLVGMRAMRAARLAMTAESAPRTSSPAPKVAAS